MCQPGLAHDSSLVANEPRPVVVPCVKVIGRYQIAGDFSACRANLERQIGPWTDAFEFLGQVIPYALLKLFEYLFCDLARIEGFSPTVFIRLRPLCDKGYMHVHCSSPFTTGPDRSGRRRHCHGRHYGRQFR